MTIFECMLTGDNYGEQFLVELDKDNATRKECREYVKTFTNETFKIFGTVTEFEAEWLGFDIY